VLQNILQDPPIVGVLSDKMLIVVHFHSMGLWKIDDLQINDYVFHLRNLENIFTWCTSANNAAYLMTDQCAPPPTHTSLAPCLHWYLFSGFSCFCKDLEKGWHHVVYRNCSDQQGYSHGKIQTGSNGQHHSGKIQVCVIFLVKLKKYLKNYLAVHNIIQN
jgi:hypothetical protein